MFTKFKRGLGSDGDMGVSPFSKHRDERQVGRGEEGLVNFSADGEGRGNPRSPIDKTLQSDQVSFNSSYRK